MPDIKDISFPFQTVITIITIVAAGCVVWVTVSSTGERNTDDINDHEDRIRNVELAVAVMPYIQSDLSKILDLLEPK